MASLKEIKTRIASVGSTLKITSAMKMVASSKLRKVQNTTVSLKRYKDSLSEILGSLLAGKNISLPLTETHQTKERVTIIAISSNSSLCGSFNANIIKALNKTVYEYKSQDVNEIEIIPIGEKVARAAEKIAGIKCHADYRHWAENRSYNDIAGIARRAVDSYINGDTDEVVIVYTRFNSMSSQTLESMVYLPMDIDKLKHDKTLDDDYILEPSADSIIARLLPYTLSTILYDVYLSSNVSEHAARMIAMQTATDNAQEMLDDLKITYNKQRQQAITEELTAISNSSK